MADIKLLDCTLRDGGYVNSWQWGFGSARRIIQTLTRAGVDVVEVGFLRNVDGYDPDVTVCNTIEELNRLLAIAIKQFAKRQMTWFRRDGAIHWLRMDGQPVEEACELITAFLAEG